MALPGGGARKNSASLVGSRRRGGVRRSLAPSARETCEKLEDHDASGDEEEAKAGEHDEEERAKARGVVPIRRGRKNAEEEAQYGQGGRSDHLLGQAVVASHRDRREDREGDGRGAARDEDREHEVRVVRQVAPSGGYPQRNENGREDRRGGRARQGGSAEPPGSGSPGTSCSHTTARPFQGLIGFALPGLPVRVFPPTGRTTGTRTLRRPAGSVA